MELIDTLLNVTDGKVASPCFCFVCDVKIFVEKQRARLVLLLSHIKEEEDKIDEAAKIIQEIQVDSSIFSPCSLPKVETFGAMKMKEKTDYILEQMRLTLKNKDMIRTQIISRKINEKVLNADDFQDQKIRFNQQMVCTRSYSHRSRSRSSTILTSLSTLKSRRTTTKSTPPPKFRKMTRRNWRC